MKQRITLFVLLLAIISVAASGTGALGTNASGTDVDIYNTRNPFEFVKKKAVKKVRKIPKAKKVETKVDLIMLKDNENMAVIGEKIYRVGDLFEGNIIISITLEYVELSTSDGMKRLYLK